MENGEGISNLKTTPIPSWVEAGSRNLIAAPMGFSGTPSPISIGSIQIDLSAYSAAMQDNTGPCTCNHTFSIRGFTAEMRKKNMNACFPFPPMEGDRLPPLEVPNFRYWKCLNCVMRKMNGTNLARDGLKDHNSQPAGIVETGTNVNNPLIIVDEINDQHLTPFANSKRASFDQTAPPPINVINWAHQNPAVSAGGNSLSSLIGNKEIHANNSRAIYEKVLMESSKRLPKNFRTGSTSNLIKQKLHNSSTNAGVGSSNSDIPRAGRLTGSTSGGSKKPEMRNLQYHQLPNQGQNRLMNNIDKEIDQAPLDLNRAGCSSYTALLLGQDTNVMENRQTPRLAEDIEGIGNSKRKRINDTDKDLNGQQKTRLLTELMMDTSDHRRARDNSHLKDSKKASILNSSVQARKNQLGTSSGRKNLICDLNEEIPQDMEISIPNHQHQPHQHGRDVSGGGSLSRDQKVERIAKNIPKSTSNSPLAGRNSGKGLNQSVKAASSNHYRNHYNIGQVVKNTAADSTSSKQRRVEIDSSPNGNDGNCSNPIPINDNNNGQKDQIWPKKIGPTELSIFEKYTENPWISKGFNFDLNKEAIDPSEAIPAMQLLSLKNATGFNMPSSGFPFGSFSSYKTGEPSSSSAEPVPTINFGPEYLNTKTKETLTPFQPEETNSQLVSQQQEQEQEQPMVVENTNGQMGLTKSNILEAGPSRSVNINNFCSVNRNPAEFTVLGARNEYMINGKDLKMGKGKGKGKGKEKGKGKAAASCRGKRTRARLVVDGRKRKRKEEAQCVS